MGYALARSEHRTVGRMTETEYFDFEERAEERHMYLEGEVVAMAGGTYEHSAIITNVLSICYARLEGTPCQVLESNMRVKYGRKALYGYADGVIVCGPPEFQPHKDKKLTLLNPTVVFEVLSDSTREFDRIDKVDLYGEIESLKQYVMIEQAFPRVEVLTWNDDGTWKVTPYTSMDDVVSIESAGVSLTMCEIYRRAAFATQA